MARLAQHPIESRPGTHAVHRLGYYRSKYALKAEMYPIAAGAEDTTITLHSFSGIEPEQQLVTVDFDQRGADFGVKWGPRPP